MRKTASIFVLIILLRSWCTKTVLASTSETDVTALQAIAQLWTNANELGWNGNDPCGSRWTGVTCDAEQKINVVKLTLSGFGLQGTLSAAIGNLPFLVGLDLSFNPDLKGNIPSSLGSLATLRILDLQACSFTGTIPQELGNLKALHRLSLNRNNLTGSIPYTLGNMTKLTWLDVSENFLEGELPTSTRYTIGLDNLTAALHFHLNNNSLSGMIPKEICQLHNLLHLLLDSNKFSGSIPSEIGNLQDLKVLRLDNNQFSGPLPSNISNIQYLVEIHVRNNQLRGPLPDFSNFSILSLVSLGINNFDAQVVPQTLAKSHYLLTLDVDRNNLIGEFPVALLESQTLQSISAIGNNLTGTLDFQHANSLAIAKFDDNNITDVLFGGHDDINVTLVGNPVCNSNSRQLSANVCGGAGAPKASATVTSSKLCKYVDCGKKTQNPITCHHCQYPCIIEIQLTSPPFTDLTQETLTNLSADLQKTLNLTHGQVWVENATLTKNLRIIATVYLFASGSKDWLSDNEFDRISASIREGDTLGFLQIYGPYALRAIYQRPPPHHTSKQMGAAIIIGITIGVVAAVIILSIGLYAFRQKHRADKAIALSKQFVSMGAARGENPSGLQLKGAQFFTLAELKKATDNFSPSNEVGHGAYGKVYKGTLATGELVAVKKAEGGKLKHEQEFKTEIELLSRVHHKNLVGLIGFCFDEGEQVLVYEYMAKGSLRDKLHGSPALTWKTRIDIALNSAKGIAYLHEMANPPIIHRDIKPSNILLDDKCTAKVADFGISRPDAANAEDSFQVKGTMGYLDPEYYMSQQVNQTSDVYSFGVVMLEIVTARPPVEKGRHIMREVRSALKTGGIKGVAGLLDPRLGSYPLGDLEKYVKLALRCTNDTVDHRPTMGNVVKELEALVPNAARYDEAMEVVGSAPHSPLYTDESSDYTGGIQIPTALVEPK